MRAAHSRSVFQGNDVANTLTQSNGGRVPVVSIGASAGGVAALQAFFESLPADVGAAFVVIVHLDPQHSSDLSRIISLRTDMPVIEVNHEQRIEPDKIYVIPPNRQLQVSADKISSSPFDKPHGQRAAIDQFFRSMADHHGDGFAIILTGAGTDGSLGVRAVKEAGGLILVQDPDEAEYPSMPLGAIASGAADFVLPVREIAQRLPELIRSKNQLAPEGIFLKDEETLHHILTYLRLKTGHDFSQYKRPTVVRRLARRMQVTHAETLPEYLGKLRENSEEVQALLGELLISVTSFFRDSYAFQALARSVLPKLFAESERHKESGFSLRVWVPACATGEEVYSLVILLLEEAANHDIPPAIQVFASDPDSHALAIAREGSYPVAIAADVSEERLRKFFFREGDSYKIKRDVRDLIIFAPHNVLRDPPFSHIDLVSCRNLLIYLDRDLQEQVCRTFHYALRSHGYLFLGAAESIDAQNLFRIVDREARVFQAIEHLRTLPPVPRAMPGSMASTLRTFVRPESKRDFVPEHRQALEVLAPPSMLVDETHHIINMSETAGRFLLQPAGPISNLSVDVVRPELRVELQRGLYRAFEEEEPTLTPGIAVQFNGHVRLVNLHIFPQFRENQLRLALVLFLDGGVASPPNEKSEPVTADEASAKVIIQLRKELAASEAHLRESRAQFEGINEELRASNEELQSTNEEYRSTSEELETSKEELQSINEELQTLNNELKYKLDAVSRANSDLQNLMASTDVATLFLDVGFHIKRFTPRVSELFNVKLGDEGRLITDYTNRVTYPELIQDAERVLSSLVPIERTIRSVDGHWLLVRVRPYRTLDDKIDGVVITFVDVTDRQEAEQRWERKQQLLLDDLSHRFGNTLAVIQAITKQTLQRAGADTDVQKLMNERLKALAATHNLLVNNESGVAELGALARAQLAPYLDGERVRLEGPQVNLASDLATSIGLLLHELGTNAVKHGALSNDKGRVSLKWQVIESEQEKRLKLLWSEQGGPRVQAPERTGFGSTLLNQGLGDAQVHNEFRPEGLLCTVELPLRRPKNVRER